MFYVSNGSSSIGVSEFLDIKEVVTKSVSDKPEKAALRSNSIPSPAETREKTYEADYENVTVVNAGSSACVSSASTRDCASVMDRHLVSMTSTVGYPI